MQTDFYTATPLAAVEMAFADLSDQIEQFRDYSKEIVEFRRLAESRGAGESVAQRNALSTMKEIRSARLQLLATFGQKLRAIAVDAGEIGMAARIEAEIKKLVAPK